MKATANNATKPKTEAMASNVSLRTVHFTSTNPFFVALAKKIAPPTGESAAGLFPREALTIDAFSAQRSSPKLCPRISTQGAPVKDLPEFGDKPNIWSKARQMQPCGDCGIRETNACQCGRANS